MSLSDTMGTTISISDAAAGLYKMVNVLVLQGSLALHTQGSLLAGGRGSPAVEPFAWRLSPAPPSPSSDTKCMQQPRR